MALDNWKVVDEKYYLEALKKIQEIVKIPSFRGKSQSDAPYGEAIKKVLDYAIELGTELGFKAYKDSKNRYGYLDYGEGSKIFAILCHLDVVPPGNEEEWDTPPFKPIIKDGKLYGRGAIDDKGPTIINLYALKFLKDIGFKPDYKIRLIFGLAEETDWASIKAYMANEDHPALGYTPDGQFPVVYAEKGIMNADIVGKGQPFTLKGGNAYNSVLDLVTYKGPHMNEILHHSKYKNVFPELVGDSILIKGKAAHGSMPERGFNAGIAALVTYAEWANDSTIANFVKKNLYNNFSFSNIFPEMKDESGLLIVNNGIIEIDKENTRLTLNMRVPITYNLADIQEPLEAELKKYDLKLTKIEWQNPLHMSIDSPMIKTMMEVYQKATNDHKSKPVAIGGGTYAKAIQNCVAFGAEFDVSKSTMHSYNEYVELKELKTMLDIYVNVLMKLTKK